MTYILGLSAYYHDSAAALLCDGEIIAAAQEERFTRIRHDAAFPGNSIQFCLKQAGISFSDIDHIVFYDKPLLKFERLLETHLATAPFGLRAFIKAMPVWLKEKLYLKKVLREALSAIGECKAVDLPALLFSSHHQAHAASAYYASPYDKSAVLCLDGVGEWATTTAWLAEGRNLKPLWQINFPHSLGLLYSAFTYYMGFRVNSGEYKLMGLAPYGEAKYVDLILDNLIDIKQDGSFHLDMSFFNFAAGLTMTSKKFHDLFGAEPREPETEIRQRDMDLAKSIQVVTEDIVLRLAKKLHLETGMENLCLAGGVALNCVANGRLLDENIFKNIWVQPAAGDAGGALGAAYLVWYQYLNNIKAISQQDHMHGALLGAEYSDNEIENVLLSTGAKYKKYESEELLKVVSGYLNSEKVVGWFQGKMEFGPRALGSRSILGDPRSKNMQSIINIKIKNRESFRPFAPAILFEKLSDWFEMSVTSPYMLFVTHLKNDKCFDVGEDGEIQGLDKLKIIRSQVPSITHVDNTARVQSVSDESNMMFFRLLSKFNDLTQCPILINTSFNVRGEPIVESPDDALACFMTTGMDVLAIGSYVLLKNEQPDDLLEKLEHRKTVEKQQAPTIELLPKELRQFAISTGVAASLIFGWFFPWLADLKPDIDFMLGSILWIAWGLFFPTTLRPVYKSWMLFGSMMGRFMTPFILSITYFALITPAGLIMRLLGNDPLSRKLDNSVDSYCVKSENIEPSDLEKPF